jgi:glucosamine-6-phosphate deaminase
VSTDPSPPPLRTFTHQGLTFHVYARPEDMGAASAHALADRQIELAQRQDSIGFMVMAAPSAFAFYDAYTERARRDANLRAALHKTDFFQFDDYPLPAAHPATFRYLLDKHFISRVRALVPEVRFHPLNVDARDAGAVCVQYTERVLASGPDLQLKGVGENGHWGFHEPGVPLDGPPAFIRVALSEENAAQQLRDHPALFRTPADVPAAAYTANVALFLRTRVCIEDNVPQASKAFALLAAYGSDIVDMAVPSSALKRHPCAVVRTTTAAAWALEEYVAREIVSRAALTRMTDAMAPGSTRNAGFALRLRTTLDTMGIRTEA